ncbi:MAG: hypothetical protein Q7S96_00505 [bacterium]|nr:hypothetical protein [bacterium]
MDREARRSWFALQGWQEDILDVGRQRQAQWSWRKLRKARRWSRVLRRIPGIRMIAIGNALGYGNCRAASDIDLVIITAPGRIWTARFLIVSILKLFRQRPGEHGADALCPSFFLTTDALCLESLQLPERQSSIVNHQSPIPPDPYLLFWPTQLTVLFDAGGVYDRFWSANAAWVRRWLPDAEPRAIHPRWGMRVRSLAARSSQLARVLESLVRAWQLPRLLRAFPQANRDTSVIMNDSMLKFHTHDRRQEFRDAWMAQLALQPSPFVMPSGSSSVMPSGSSSVMPSGSSSVMPSGSSSVMPSGSSSVISSEVEKSRLGVQ